jgi:2-methylcitrate dehydratase
MDRQLTTSCYDPLLVTIADYVENPPVFSAEAYQTARLAFADALGCAILALKYPECQRLLGPVVVGTVVPRGARVPGTPYVLDPIRAAFNIGMMVRWLDYNDTWLAAEWGHPSDNLGGLLAVADYISRRQKALGGPPMTMQRLFHAMISAYEIQGCLALENSFNRIGLDHVILVKVATAAVVTKMFGGTHRQVLDALSQAFVDGGALRTYRHGENTGSRKSWAAGDATSRGVLLAMLTLQGEPGYPTALSAKQWGLYDVLFGGKPLRLERPLGSYVMENILFKVAFPAEFHAQTAVEAAMTLHPLVRGQLDEIEQIEILTQESAMRIIDKKGILRNPADRDHCLQYMVAIGLIHGALTADHYQEAVASDPRVDQLRGRMVVKEHSRYSQDYVDPSKRSIANALQVRLRSGKILGPVEVEYPLGHRCRRTEAMPWLLKKLEDNLSTCFVLSRVRHLMAQLTEDTTLAAIGVSQLIDRLVD